MYGAQSREMRSICFEYDERGWNRDLWLYVITGFGVGGFERGRDPEMTGNHFGTVAVQDVYDLPTDRPLVVLQPLASSFPGEISLKNFVHPENAIYYFGSDRGNTTAEDLEGLEYDLVYVPQADNVVQNELWTHQIGGIVLYDAMTKAG